MRSSKLYDQDYQTLEGIKALADTHGVAVLIIHHLRKMQSEDKLDLVSGTTGLTGAADTILILQRGGRGRADAFLSITGRDVEESELALEFRKNTCSWFILGEADEYRRTRERQEVLDILLNNEQPMRPKELAAILEKNENAISKTLYRLKEEGLVTQPGYGKYIATCQSGQSSHNDHNSQTCPGSKGTNSD
jgi:DNA-binding transcriptional ArsR family regulator